MLEHGSFSAAAVVLSTTASVLSRAVSRLESRLVEVLPGLGGRTRTFSVIYPAHRGLSAASRALIEMLAASHARPAAV